MGTPFDAVPAHYTQFMRPEYFKEPAVVKSAAVTALQRTGQADVFRLLNNEMDELEVGDFIFFVRNGMLVAKKKGEGLEAFLCAYVGCGDKPLSGSLFCESHKLSLAGFDAGGSLLLADQIEDECTEFEAEDCKNPNPIESNTSDPANDEELENFLKIYDLAFNSKLT